MGSRLFQRAGTLALTATVAGWLWAAPQTSATGKDAGQARPGMHQGAHWKEKLGLTDEQSTKLKAAMEAHRNAVKPLHEQRKQAMEKLKSQIAAKAADNDIQATLDQLKTTQKSIEAEKDKMVEATAGFLTPTQRAKMMLGMLHRMRGGGMAHGKGMNGGQGEPMMDHPEDDTPGM